MQPEAVPSYAYNPYPAGPSSSSAVPYGYAGPYEYAAPAGQDSPKVAAGRGVLPAGVGSAFDVESQVLHQFAEKEVRSGFIAKVFGIVTIQLAITVAFSLVCLFVSPLKDYVRATRWPFYLSWGLSFGLLLVLSCSETLRRRWPINMVLLSLFTLFQAFLIGMITSYFNIEAVMLAFLVTCVAVGVLSLIACQKKIDVTSWGTYLLIPSVVVLMLIFIGIFWINRVVYLIISGVAALLACVYLVYDLQLIMGGKTYAISPDEYVFAAMSVYLDIVQVFIFLLALIGIGGGARQ